MIEAIVALVIIGVVLYLVETYIPMSPPIKVITRVLIILFVCLWLLNFLGYYSFPNRRL